MKRTAILFLSLAVWKAAPATPLEHSVSPSRQFIIYGGSVAARGAVSNLVEQIKANLLQVLRQRDAWQRPITVSLQPQQANLPEIPPAALRVVQTGFGVKLQLDLCLCPNLDAHFAERELLRAILVEMIYRRESALIPGSAIVEPPDWLLEGLLALGEERAPFAEALATIDEPPSLAEFLRQRPALLDSAGRTLYRAYSLALVRLLAEAKDGPASLARYIGSLSQASRDPLADLKLHFPSLNANPEQRWRLALAQLRNVEDFHLLGFTESDRRLDELLGRKIPEPNKLPRSLDLEELAARKISSAEKVALSQLNRDLLLLSLKAHPVLRPIAREYQEIAALLARGKRRGLARRLANLRVVRQQLRTRMTELEDYMNWFEATQMPSRSGNFLGYLRAADQMQLSLPSRHDPLSLYLDSMAAQIER